MPPPETLAVFREIVQSFSVAPYVPPPLSAEFPLTVQKRSVPLYAPPPLWQHCW
jgi:hypothetical protein